MPGHGTCICGWIFWRFIHVIFIKRYHAVLVPVIPFPVWYGHTKGNTKENSSGGPYLLVSEHPSGRSSTVWDSRNGRLQAQRALYWKHFWISYLIAAFTGSMLVLEFLLVTSMEAVYALRDWDLYRTLWQVIIVFEVSLEFYCLLLVTKILQTL